MAILSNFFDPGFCQIAQKKAPTAQSCAVGAFLTLDRLA
jgi:hypothetical protein